MLKLIAVAIQRQFSFFFSSSFFFSHLSLQSFTFGPQNLPLSPSSCLFIEKQGIWGHDNLPKQAVTSFLSNLARPGNDVLNLFEKRRESLRYWTLK